MKKFRKNGLYFTSLIILGIHLTNTSNAQVIENKLDVHVGYVHGFLSGSSTISENGFVMPSLFGNINNSNGILLSATYKIKPILSVGLGVSSASAGNWSYLSDGTYRDSMTQLNSLSVPVRFHTPYSPFDLFNWLSFYGELSPVIGFSNLRLANPIMVAQTPGQGNFSPMEETSTFFGIKASVGLKAAISPRLGLFAEYSFNENSIEGLLFVDRRFGGHSLSAGIFIRLSEVKMFF